MASTNILLKLLILILFCSSPNFFVCLEAFTFPTNTNNSNDVVSCIDKERNALVKFKEGVVDSSDFLSSWNGSDCCNWGGVTCNYSTGQVLNLNLSYNSFSGMISPSLGNLSNLRVLDFSYSNSLWVSNLNWLSGLSSLEFLDLSYVNLSLATTHWLQAVNMLPSLSQLYLQYTNLGNIPVSLAHLNLTSLSVLALSYNNFRTQPPQWLFNITSLKVLHLDGCNFNGSISTIVQGSGFCSFQKLDLSYNELSGRINELVEGSLSRCGNNSLEELDLSLNQLSGQLPNSLGHLKYLKTLSLSHNSISGPLPKSIGELLKLEKLYLGYNKMNGSIPKSLGKLENLQMLDLLQNDWEGVISQDCFQGLSKLKELRISSTKPSFVWNLSSNWVPPFSLNYLVVSDIKLGPKFPHWIQTQTQIDFFSLRNVSISEIIPNWFWKMCGSIWYLDLSDNQIRGTIPQRSVVFPSGAQILLSNNAIEGPLPLWPNVSYLHLSNNSFSGPIPSDIGHIMSQLEFLILSSNSLNGSIPSSLGTMENLLFLDLSNNSFSGPIPSDIGQIMSQLQTLILSSNSLNGSIPSSLGTMKNLVFLDINNNHLFGEVHDKWMGENIRGIDLSMNNLSGNIPASLCSSPSLTRLKLSKNMFSGELSSSLKKCKHLNMLDLGGNRLSGRIPKWIGESLSLLQELSLQGNLFNGRISKRLCHLQQLHVLDLGQNNLSGPIPPCLGNLTTMKSTNGAEEYDSEYHFMMELFIKGRESAYDYRILPLVKLIDLSNNILGGYVPDDITNLSGLNSLNLSNNHLNGEIPHRIGELKNLETLDLSSNLISGQIPRSMTSMAFLNNLNLSHNNLSGPIPSSTQFTTFDKSIYEGNPGLCGAPLPKKCTLDVVNEDGDHQHVGQNEDKKEEKEEKLGMYVSIILGFFVGFWSICGSLVIMKPWRDAYYGFLYKMKDYIFMVVTVKVNKFQRMIGKTNN